jgi:hypothetical protein
MPEVAHIAQIPLDLGRTMLGFRAITIIVPDEIPGTIVGVTLANNEPIGPSILLYYHLHTEYWVDNGLVFVIDPQKPQADPVLILNERMDVLA